MPGRWRVFLSAITLRSSCSIHLDVSDVNLDERAKPKAEGWKELRRMSIDTASMVKLEIEPWDGSSENITIMGYPSKEDKEISGSLHYSSKWENWHTNHLCRPWSTDHLTGVFLDVGANIGTYTLPMSACIAHSGHHGAVISIEGMPSIADHLRAGIKANSAENVVLYDYAVGEKNGPKYVTMLLDPENKGGSSVAGNKAGDKSITQMGQLKSTVREVKVPLTHLDAMLQRDPRLTAVLSAKVDIEGNEGRFLNGAERFFSTFPPCYLMIELIHEWLASAGTPLPAILEQLTAWGYTNVPTYEKLTHCSWRMRTIHIQQLNMKRCHQRVAAAYAKL